MKKKTFQVKAQGNSMYPILQNGDTVEYIQTPFRAVQLNDIILVYVNDILMTHRVIYKTKNTCITRGDNNKSAEASIQKGRVLARVVRFKRGGKWHGIQEVYFAQSTLYLHEIQKLETLLTLHKIPHVFLKGVLISLRYENTIPKRIYADCDLLIQRNDYKKIENIFHLLGYSLQGRELFTTKQQNQENKPEVSYWKIVKGVPVVFDVHFEPVFLMTQLSGMNLLYPASQLKLLGNEIINRGKPYSTKGFKFSLCSVSDQILYLALHIFHHNFTDSMRYQLLDAVVRKSAPRNNMWRELAKTIKEYQLEGYVYGVFVLLKKYFHTPIPPSFFKSICPSRFALYVSRFAIRHTDIFSQDIRVKAGIQRFFLIFLLSPNPFWKKALLLIHPEVVATAIRLTFSFLSARVFRAKQQSAQSNTSAQQRQNKTQ